jgi:signal transduction histidine kinase
MGAASTDNGPGPLAFAMIGLTSSQLRVVTSAVHTVPVEKRDLYLQRISAMLTLRGRGHYNDRDVMEVAQLAPAGEGTGLGLSISHDIIVKQHGGSIEVDTQPGEFTEFTIILPRAAVLLAESGGRV